MNLTPTVSFLLVLVSIGLAQIRVSGAQLTIHSPANTHVLITIPTNVAGGYLPTNLFRDAAFGTGVKRAGPFFDQRVLDPDIGAWTDSSPLTAGWTYWLASPASVSQTFIWEISGPPAPVTPPKFIPNVYYYVGAINGGTNYEDIAGPPTNDVALFRSVPPSAPWQSYWNQYVYHDGTWSPSPPTIRPGEGVLVVSPPLSLTSSPATNRFASIPRINPPVQNSGAWRNLFVTPILDGRARCPQRAVKISVPKFWRFCPEERGTLIFADETLIREMDRRKQREMRPLRPAAAKRN